MPRATERILRDLRSALELRYLQQQADEAAPVRFHDRWIPANRVHAATLLARNQPGAWLTGAVQDAAAGSVDLARPRGAARAVQRSRLHPWETPEAVILADAGRAGAPSAAERRLLPWAAVRDSCLAGHTPVLVAQLHGPPLMHGCHAVRSVPVFLVAGSACELRIMSRAAAEAAVARRVADTGTAAVVLREPDGRARTALLAQAALQLRGCVTVHGYGSPPGITWRRATTAVETVCGMDGLIAFPSPS